VQSLSKGRIASFFDEQHIFMTLTKRGFRPSSRDRRTNSGEVASGGSRLLPHSIESEEAVLGGILLDNDAINYALERVLPEDFYKPANVLVYAAMKDLSEKHEPIDIVTLTQRLRATSSLEESGGIDYLSRIASMVPSSANVGFYARLVKEHSLRRKVIKEASDIINEAFSEETELAEFLDATEARILGISDNRISRSFFPVNEVVRDSIKLIEELFDKKELVTGTASGFEDLDKKTAGFQPGDLIIIAARPSMGKTALALGIAANASLGREKAVAFFSLEMSKESLVLRLLCSEAGVDMSRVRTGHLGERDFPRLVEAASRLSDAPLFLDDTGALTITEVRAKSRRLHKEHPLGLVVVDYLQLLRSPSYSNVREQEISDISRSLKALAKELGVPVIALSQLNRSVESRENKRPQMSDLRESGAIEQDADLIMYIYRDEVYRPDSPEKGIAEIIISKQRNGPTGTVKLAFSSEITRFDNLAHEPTYDTPPPHGAVDPFPGGSEDPLF
jgi:replicative DNA helicase